MSAFKHFTKTDGIVSCRPAESERLLMQPTARAQYFFFFFFFFYNKFMQYAKGTTVAVS